MTCQVRIKTFEECGKHLPDAGNMVVIDGSGNYGLAHYQKNDYFVLSSNYGTDIMNISMLLKEHGNKLIFGSIGIEHAVYPGLIPYDYLLGMGRKDRQGNYEIDASCFPFWATYTPSKEVEREMMDEEVLIRTTDTMTSFWYRKLCLRVALQRAATKLIYWLF